MIKKTLLFLTVITLCINVNSTSFATNINPETQIIEESKAKFNQLDEKITSLNSDISKLNIEIEEINNKLNSNNEEIEKADLQIKLINSQIEDAKVDIEENQKILDNRIRSMYKSNITTDILAYILTSDNLLDAFNRIYSMSKIISLDKEVINEINEKSEFLIKSSEDLNKKKSDLKSLNLSVEKDLSSLHEKQSKQQEGLDELSSEKNRVASTIEENEKLLISSSLSIINSDSSTSEQLKAAIKELESLIPLLNSDYVLDLANSAILDGHAKIDAMEIENNKPNNSITPNKPNENNSGNETYLATYTMEATAYTGGTITASGFKPVRDPNGISTIAVDPNVIPLGSKVFIPGYGYAIAADTGGVIKGNIIDLYLNSLEECKAWGRRNVTLHLISLP